MQHIFLSYINRSGSTFFVNQLSKIPEICICPEADILYDLLLTNPDHIIQNKDILIWGNQLKRDLKFRSWKLDITTFLTTSLIGNTSVSLFFLFLNKFREKYFPASSYILFKHNHLIRIIDNKELCSYNIKWIALLRDPRAVFNSQKRTINAETDRPMCSNPITFMHLWNSYFKKIIKYSTQSDVLFILQYEELIDSPVIELNRVLSHIGFSQLFDEFVSNPPQHSKWILPKYLLMHPLIDLPAHKTHIEKWLHELARIDIIIIQRYCIKNSYYIFDNESRSGMPSILMSIIIFTLNDVYYRIKKSLSANAKKYFVPYNKLKVNKAIAV